LVKLNADPKIVGPECGKRAVLKLEWLGEGWM